jgi:hypothetical protein
MHVYFFLFSACPAGHAIVLLQDAQVIGGLLGCFGQLFTATLAPGWTEQAAAAAEAADVTSGGAVPAAPDNLAAGGSSGNGGGSSTASPQAVLTVSNNDVTRVRANLEAASFESAVPPSTAVRLLQVVCLAVALKFFDSSSKRMTWLSKVSLLVAANGGWSVVNGGFGCVRCGSNRRPAACLAPCCAAFTSSQEPFGTVRLVISCIHCGLWCSFGL